MGWFSLWALCELLAWVVSPLIFSILALGPIQGMRNNNLAVGSAPLRWFTLVNFILATIVSMNLWLTPS